jgi:hypothetical protein
MWTPTANMDANNTMWTPTAQYGRQQLMKFAKKSSERQKICEEKLQRE